MNEFVARLCTCFVGGFIFFGIYFFSKTIFLGLLIGIFFYISFFEWPRLFPEYGWKFWIALIYPAIAIMSLLYLCAYYYQESILVPLYPFFAAWVYDTGGYLVGKCFGRYKICPRISPGKTAEGIIGSFLFLCILNYVLFWNSWHDGVYIFIGSLFLTCLAFFGGIFFSSLKRRVNLKDSGSMLPGHGGLIDRFDSVFAIAIGVVVFFLISEIEVDYLWRYTTYAMS